MNIVVVQDIAVSAGGLGFDFRSGKIGYGELVSSKIDSSFIGANISKIVGFLGRK